MLTPEKDEALDARLAALDSYRIIDTPEEAGFDDIVRLAAHVCETPVSLVSLIEADRQWFKARVGFEACETPIGQSVCQHALAQTELLIIPDLTRDPRTQRNTLVTEDPFIRFYAGAPLVTPAGAVIGTLCVIDQTPRPEGLSDIQAEMLQALARQVIGQLELRKSLLTSGETATLLSSARVTADDRRERSLLAEEAGGVGTFELEIATNQLKVSPEYCRIFGLPIEEMQDPRVSEKLVLKEDAHLRSSPENRKSGTARGDVEYRIRRANDGAIRWIARRAQFVRNGEGQAVAMYGTVIDVTDRHRADAQQKALLELGDQLREVESVQEASRIAASILGQTLGGKRAGYGRVNLSAGTMTVEGAWGAAGSGPIDGEIDLGTLTQTLARLRAGQTLAIDDMPAAEWLGSDLAVYLRTDTRAMIDIPLFDHGTLSGIAFAHDSRPRHWTRDEIDFARGVADRTYSAMAQLDSEAARQVLNRELGHRMKNQLAMVQAIVGQTLRTAPDLETAGRNVTARVQVLASAHDILISGSAGHGAVGEIVRKVALLHDDVVDRRFSITGPKIAVASRPALSLALILHELSTNATKYGALSVEHGSVTIDWAIERNENGPRFVLTWQEINGPPVVNPTRKGTGTRLIQAGLGGTAESKVTVTYAPSGLTCRIEAELNSFQSE